ncbi:hypothetical protein ACLOJK_000509 [Asimina triloba]
MPVKKIVVGSSFPQFRLQRYNHPIILFGFSIGCQDGYEKWPNALPLFPSATWVVHEPEAKPRLQLYFGSVWALRWPLSTAITGSAYFKHIPVAAMVEEANETQQAPNESSTDNILALLEAARYDELDDVMSLATMGVALDSKDSEGRTASYRLTTYLRLTMPTRWGVKLSLCFKHTFIAPA